jgi:CarD family transcriptional regulator
MASLKKSTKKSKAGASARTSKAKSAKSSAKRSLAKTAASTSARSRKPATTRAASARAGSTRKSTAKTSGKSAQKSARTIARAGTSKSKAAAARRNSSERKTTPVEMRNKKTVSAPKATAARNKTAPATQRKASETARRAVTKPAKAANVIKATKIAATSKPAIAVETLVDKVKDVTAKATQAAKTAAAVVVEAAPAATTAAAPKAVPAAPKPALKAAAAKTSSKPETSASTILLETIRRVGQAAAAEAKARVVAPAAAAIASVVSAASAGPEPKVAAPVPPFANEPAPAAPVTTPQRPGFGGPMGGRPGDSRLHQLQPRPVVKPTGPRPGFKLEEFIVYPAHGVGQIVAIEEQEVAGFKLELYVISFAKDKMTLKVPTPKVVSVGMRKLAEPALVQKALDVLTGRARIKRTMWSRRAQEYEAKINSGDLIAISEVIRDLYRSEAQPEQSYSERQLYEAALDRMAREIGAVQKLTETETLKLIEGQLQKGPRRGVKAEGESDTESEGADAEVEEAAA